MSVKQSVTSGRLLKNHAKSAIHRAAARAVGIEKLEERRLLSATLTLVNPDSLPSNNRLIFNYIQNLDPAVPNVVDDQQSLQITDTGTTPLVINSMAISGPWAFVGAPAGGYTDVTVNPGTPLAVTLAFTQRSLPPHTSNETNYTTETNGGAFIDGSLTIISNDPTNPTTTVTLAGYWQNQSADEEEPSLATIVNSVAGYDTVTATASQLQSESNGVDLQNNGATPTYYGQEVASTSWEAANPSQPVKIQELAEYYIEGTSDTTYWYSAATETSHALMTSAPNQGQTFLPMQANGQLMEASFTPGGPFGLRGNNLYSDDAINVANGDTVDDGHRFRFYPLIDENGNAVANSWLVAVHEGTSLADYQDAVYVVSNMAPAPTATTPPAPTNLTATNAADPVLTWTGVTYADLAGYNVYRSTSPTGTFTKLTSSPTLATTFTDSASPPAGTTLYYRVTAVDSTTGNESAPATTTANTPGGPLAQSFTVSAFTDQALIISVLSHVTDSTGTPTASSLAIATAPTHGIATVDTTNGLITYTSAVGFTGTDTIVYTISDSNDAGPSTGTITVDVVSSSNIAPIASPQFGVTLANTPVVLAPTALNSAGGSIVPSLVEIAITASNFTSPLPTTLTTAAGGTITLNTNNTVTYTPASNFVGSDSFLFKVEDSAGNLSGQATFTINVGVQIASTKGANKSLVYPDASGQLVTVALSKGVADVYYNGTGTESAAKGKITVTGSNLTISNIAASQTTAASALTLQTKHNAGSITLGGVTDTGVLGSITGLSTNLAGENTRSGTIAVDGVRSINLKSISSASVGIGNTGVTSDSLTAGVVTNSFFSSAVTVSSFKVASWSNTAGNLNSEAITAPVIKSLTVAGEFDANLALSGSGNDLISAKVSGAVNDGLWSIAGSAGSITLKSVDSQWGGVAVTGALNSLKVSSGGLPADITAGSINNLTVAGTLSGNVTTTGNINSLQAGQLVGSLIDVGSTATSLADATLANLGAATLKNLRLTSKAANSFTFSDSSVIAGTIDSVTTGSVNTTGTPEGLAAAKIKAATLTVGGDVLHLNAADLLSDSALQTFLTAKGVSLGTFAVDIL